MHRGRGTLVWSGRTLCSSQGTTASSATRRRESVVYRPKSSERSATTSNWPKRGEGGALGSHWPPWAAGGGHGKATEDRRRAPTPERAPPPRTLPALPSRASASLPSRPSAPFPLAAYKADDENAPGRRRGRRERCSSRRPRTVRAWRSESSRARGACGGSRARSATGPQCERCR